MIRTTKRLESGLGPWLKRL